MRRKREQEDGMQTEKDNRRNETIALKKVPLVS
jgi:hypothetical protein